MIWRHACAKKLFIFYISTIGDIHSASFRFWEFKFFPHEVYTIYIYKAYEMASIKYIDDVLLLCSSNGIIKYYNGIQTDFEFH